MLERADLPLRDLLRIVIPGALAVLLISWAQVALTGNESLISDSGWKVVATMFATGLAGFVFSLHSRVWPWSRSWKAQLKAVRLEMRDITGNDIALDELHGRPIYKLWLEAFCLPDLRTYLHYTTGLYYCWTVSAIYSAITAAVLLVHAVWLVVYALIDSKYGFGDLLQSQYWRTMAVSGVAAGLLSKFLTSAADKALRDVINEGRIGMHVKGSKAELAKLARAASEVAIPADDVEEDVREAINEVAPARLKLVQSINPAQIIKYFDLRTDTFIRVAYVEVSSSDPRDLNGRANLFNGPMQSRVESAIYRRLAVKLNVQKVRLQIIPIDVDLTVAVEHEMKTVDQFPVQDAVDSQIIAKKGLVAKCCKKYGLSKVLVRNGKVIGPSPALAEALARFLRTLPPGAVIYDSFAGSGLTAAVCRNFSPPIDVRASDRNQNIGFDAFTESPFTDAYAIVVDPLYEDVLKYLHRIRNFSFRYLIVQAGDTIDVGWVETVKNYLQQIGTIESGYEDLASYGSHVFIVRKN